MEPWMWWVTLGITLLTALVIGVWKLSAWWKEHAMEHTRITKMLAKIDAAVTAIDAAVTSLLGRQPAIAIAGSPLRLNELGMEVSSCVDGKKLAEELAPEVRQRLPSDNPYDVQVFCQDYFETQHEPTDTFKRCAYDHGIKLKQVQTVCAIELRDELLRIIEAESAQDGHGAPVEANAPGEGAAEVDVGGETVPRTSILG